MTATAPAASREEVLGTTTTDPLALAAAMAAVILVPLEGLGVMTRTEALAPQVAKALV